MKTLTNHLMVLGSSVIRSELHSKVGGHCSWLGRGEMGQLCSAQSSDYDESDRPSRGVNKGVQAGNLQGKTQS